MPDVNEGPQRGPFAYPCPTKRAGKNVRIYTGGNNPGDLGQEFGLLGIAGLNLLDGGLGNADAIGEVLLRPIPPFARFSDDLTWFHGAVL